jgi:hypothetical protein
MRIDQLGTFVVLAFATSACEVGEVPGPGGGPGAFADPPDAGPSGPGPGDGTAAQCRPTITAVGGGEHNPGQSCLGAGCHGPGGEGPQFTLGGTLYTTAAGGTPNVGATITVRDAAGQVLDLETMQNGNFYTRQAVAYPVTVYASECPGVMPMVSAAASGDCNSAGCHAAGAPAGRVYLP